MKITVVGNNKTTRTTLLGDRPGVEPAFAGPAGGGCLCPGELLIGALGACMALTGQDWMQKEGIPFEEVTVSVTAETEGEITRIRTKTHILGSLTPGQRAQVQDVMEHCALGRILAGEMEIAHEPV